MAFGAAEIFAPLFAENDDLVIAAMLKHRGGNARALHQGLAQLDAILAAHGKNIGQFNDFAGRRRKPLDTNDILRRNTVLLPAGFNNSEHGFLVPELMLFKALPASARHYSATGRAVNKRSR